MALHPVRFDDIRAGIDGAGGAQTIRVDGSNRTVEIYNVGQPGDANFEKAMLRWSGNVFQLFLDAGGTGSLLRTIRLLNTDSSGMIFNPNGRAQASGVAGNQWGMTHASDDVGLFFNGRITNIATPSIQLGNDVFGTSFSASSGTQQQLLVTAAMNQSGTAAFDLASFQLTQTTAGSGAVRLIKATVAGIVRFGIRSNGNADPANFEFGAAPASFQNMLGGFFIANTNNAPTANPANGGFMYSEAGAGKWRGSGGTVTTFGPAEPHCPDCGRDAAHEWVNDQWEIAVCMWCITDKLGMLEGQVGGGIIRKFRKA